MKEYDMKQNGEYNELVDKQSKGFFILSLIKKFSNSFHDLIEGKYLKSQNDELIGGSRINYIFFDIFRKSISEIDPFDCLSDDDIRVAIKNANGMNPSLFIPEAAF